MNEPNLFEAVAGVGNPPCTKYACTETARCASEKLACTAFRYFVETGRSANPLIYYPQRFTLRNQPVMGDSPKPTREIFDSLDEEDDDEKTANIPWLDGAR
jgi:hypothetical protein